MGVRDTVSVELDPRDAGQLLADVREFDAELAKALGSRLRTLSKPLGQAVVRAGSQALPHRGGLSGRVARSKASASVSRSARSGGVRLRLTSPDRYELGRMDEGELRHPAFPRPDEPRSSWSWVRQSIRPGAFSRAFTAHSPDTKREVEHALVDALHTIRAGTVKT